MKSNSFRLFFLITCIQFIPFLIFQQDSYIRIHDNLEGEVHFYHLLALSKVGLDYDVDTKIPQVMDGLQRYFFHSGLSFYYMWYYLLGTFWGYVVNHIIIHLTAFFSMFFLLKRLFKLTDTASGISAAVFAWIPIYTIMGMALAMQPLLILAFYGLLNRKNKLICTLPFLIFPFYTSFVWGAPSMLLLLGVLFLYDWKKSGKLKWYPPLVLGVMTILFLIANYQLLYSLFVPIEGFVSHRSGYNLHQSSIPKFKSGIEDFLMIFVLSHYHAGLFFTLPVTLLFLYIGSRGWMKKRIINVFVAIILMSLFFAVYKWIVYFLGDAMPFIETFKADRIAKIFIPLAWCLLWAFCLDVLIKNQKLTLVKTAAAAMLIITSICNDEWLQNIRKITGNITKPVYSQFYDKKLFDKIDNHIGKDKSDYRVIHLGLNPAISQHFGFYSLDGYMLIYDLNYKNSFRKIMEEELAKDEVISTYFDDWGNRCYLLSHELGIEDSSFMFSKARNKAVNDLSMNTHQLKEMGGEYLLSSVKINHAESLDLKEEGEFYHEKSYFKIYLYKVQ